MYTPRVMTDLYKATKHMYTVSVGEWVAAFEVIHTVHVRMSP